VLARAQALQALAPPPRGFVATVLRPEAVARTLCAIPTQVQGSAAKAASAAQLVHRAAVRGPGALSKDERLRVLGNGWMLMSLHQRLAAGTAHATWTEPTSIVAVKHMAAPSASPAHAPAPVFRG
jgi:hypothetical protein